MGRTRATDQLQIPRGHIRAEVGYKARQVPVRSGYQVKLVAQPNCVTLAKK